MGYSSRGLKDEKVVLADDQHQQPCQHHHHQDHNQRQDQTKLSATPFMAAPSTIKGMINTVQSTPLVLDHHDHQQLQHNHQQQNIFSYINQSSASSSNIGNFIGKDSTSTATGSAYDMGELDQALFLYLDGQDQDQIRLGHINNMSGGISKRASEPSISVMELANNTPRNNNDSTTASAAANAAAAPSSGPQPAPNKSIKREGNRKGPTSSSEQEGPKTPDPKAYVQQLESSRIKLTQLEQELQRARNQGMFFGGGALLGGEQGIPVGISSISSDAAVFDMEYARWLEENHRMMCELRAAVQEHLPENELRLYVDNCLAHYDQVLNLKSLVVKSDVFHLVSGMWKTPAERCFMWMGGFRPSDLIKIIPSHLEPLTEQQIMAICGLQQSTQEAEEALSQGLEALNQSLSDTITSDSLSCPPNMANYMGQMALAMNKLSTLEGFVRQADNLRHQTLHRLHQILTTRQAARCLLAIAEYFHRLRALSSLWLARPRQE
ncbi:hypothetical protein TIFTF001_033386 [Ficus carica]|uniref:DOG1 domain-containing protein n=1 Tax=Ficus carica TaxID=3494 RepID=A0AA88DYE5_FICCA|nr:hypothetical protein TIFTF001_033386 [Ficus carica]